MRVKVRLFGDLKKKLGHESHVDLEEGSDVGQLLQVLGERLGSQGKLISSKREIAENLSVLVNGLSVNVGGGPDERLEDGDTISILPPSAGG